MKDNTLKYILIVSLLMNLAFVSAAAHTYFTQPGYRAVPHTEPECTLGKAAPFGQGNRLFTELALKPEQIQPLQKKASEFHSALGAKRQEVARLRGSLASLMRADRPDNESIGRTIGEINNMQRQMQEMVVSHILEFKSMLHKGQQGRFMDLIQKAMAERRETMCP